MRVLLAACMLAAMAGPAMAKGLPPGASTNAKITAGANTSMFDYAGDVDAWRVQLQAGKSYIALARLIHHSSAAGLASVA